MEHVATVFDQALPPAIRERMTQLRAESPGWPNEEGTITTTLLQRLQAIPPTHVLQDELAQCRIELPEGAKRQVRNAQQWNIEHIERALKLAALRDRVLAGRPEGCWCLGLGGKDQVALPIVDVPADGESYPMTWREFCACPDGQRAIEDRRVYLAMYETQIRDKRLRRVLGPGGLGARYANATISSWLDRVCSTCIPDDLAAVRQRAEEIARTLRRWLTDPDRPWLYIYGEFGTGKTGIVAALAIELIAGGMDARLITVPDLLDRLKDSFGVKPDDGSGRATTEQVTWGFKNCACLILDDLGQENATPWALSEFWKFINARYKERLLTIITSNLPGKELTDRYREGVAGRMLEDALVIVMDGPNLRDVRS